MLTPAEEVARRLNITPRTRVLDLGGTAIRFEHGRVTVVDVFEPEWECERFVGLDLCHDDLPFDDKEFDVCICSHTLEALDYPFRAIHEMQRVARRGYIETPSRGLESSFEVSPEQGAYPGFWHHRWMFEEISLSRFRIIPKTWHLLAHDAEHILEWVGPRGFTFYWSNKFAYEEVKIMDAGVDHWNEFVREHNEFVAKNRHQLVTANDVDRGRVLTEPPVTTAQV